MKRLALLVCAVGTAFLLSGPKADGQGKKPMLTIDTTVKTYIGALGTAGPVAFKLTDLGKGQKLPVMGSWLKKLEISGVMVDIKGVSLDTSKGNTVGSINAIPFKGKTGKYKVKITVELNDGSTVTGEAMVEFLPFPMGITSPLGRMDLRRPDDCNFALV